MKPFKTPSINSNGPKPFLNYDIFFLIVALAIVVNATVYI